jgi:DNA replication protein DnaC
MAVCIEELGEKPETCETHGEYASVGRKTPFGTFWTTCGKCEQERIVEAVKLEEEREATRVVAMYDKARLPKRYRNVGFKNFTASSPAQKSALEVAQKFHGGFDVALRDGSFLIFQGAPGTGKTHLACALLRNLLHDGATGIYLSAIDAIRMLRESWQKGAELTELETLKKLERFDLLVMDEIGVQFATDAERIQLFDILNRRYAELRPTVLITNLTVTEMQSTLGERIFDRFREVATVVTFNWPSFRGQK